MGKPRKRLWIYLGLALVVLAGIPFLLWISLTHKPKFYQQLVEVQAGEDLQAEAKQFVAQSLQLRNDIANEPNWEAIFSDREVNAWLAEDLVKHFADQLPPEVHDPRIAFEADRVTLAFGLDQGPVRSIIWVVAQARVPEDNVVSLTLEKIRAGALPVPAERIMQNLTYQARKNGLDVTWTTEAGLPVVTIRYKADKVRTDVVLERVSVRQGQIRLSGRSNRATAAAPSLPRGETLQRNFPKRKNQTVEPPPAVEAESLPQAPAAISDPPVLPPETPNSTGPSS